MFHDHYLTRSKSRLPLEETLLETKAKERRRVMRNVGLIGNSSATASTTSASSTWPRHASQDGRRGRRRVRHQDDRGRAANNQFNLPGYVSFLQQGGRLLEQTPLCNRRLGGAAEDPMGAEGVAEAEGTQEARGGEGKGVEQRQKEIEREKFIKQKRNALRNGNGSRHR